MDDLNYAAPYIRSLNEIEAKQRAKYPINEDEIEFTVTLVPDSNRIKSLRGQFEVRADHPGTGYIGWAIQKTEQEAKDKARARLLYSRDMGDRPPA